MRKLRVPQFKSKSGAGYPFICYPSDFGGANAYQNPFVHSYELCLMTSWCESIERPIIYDIGANIGFIATQLAQYLGVRNPLIYAFEPIPHTFSLLRYSICSLNLGNKVYPICAAVTKEPTIVEMNYSLQATSVATVSKNKYMYDGNTESVLSSSISLDLIVQTLKQIPSLIKIDVEGYEPDVLLGGKRLFRSDNPPAILFEFNPLSYTEPAKELQQLLPGYRFFYVDSVSGQKNDLGFGQEVFFWDKIHDIVNLFASPPLVDPHKVIQTTLKSVHKIDLGKQA